MAKRPGLLEIIESLSFNQHLKYKIHKIKLGATTKISKQPPQQITGSKINFIFGYIEKQYAPAQGVPWAVFLLQVQDCLSQYGHAVFQGIVVIIKMIIVQSCGFFIAWIHPQTDKGPLGNLFQVKGEIF